MVACRYRATWDEIAYLDCDVVRSWGGLDGYAGPLRFDGFEPAKIEAVHDRASDTLSLSYSWPRRRRDRRIACDVRIERRPCRFGGSRAYFRCPWCNRSTLRLAVLAHGLRCGPCGRITWASRRESDTQRLVRRANKIAARLGLEHFTQTPVRPRNMHLTTYMTILAELAPLKDEIGRRVKIRIARAKGRLSGWAALTRWGV